MCWSFSSVAASRCLSCTGGIMVIGIGFRMATRMVTKLDIWTEKEKSPTSSELRGFKRDFCLGMNQNPSRGRFALPAPGLKWRNKMSVRIMATVFERSQSTYGDRLVLLAIADCSNDEDRTSWPSLATIARKARLSERQARRAISNLVELGELSVGYQAGPKRCNLFTVLVCEEGDMDVRGDKLSGGTSVTKRGTSVTVKGDMDGPRTIIEPSLNHHTPIPPKGVDPSDEQFEQFWQAYPRKIGKVKAQQAWQRLRPPIDKVLETVKQWSGSEAWQKDGGQFIPHPTTWLSRGGWNDEMKIASKVTRRCY